ncbi:MAG: hypothetical protein CR997_06570 [Acidobacteria bacterium]|nr:MAG: hypothetical protein CR997_06570 [Acidobacteriota bacterium]
MLEQNNQKMNIDGGIVMKKFGRFMSAIIVLLILISIGPQLIDTVEKGTYQVRQAAITGNMSAKMTPGVWLQLFGDITVWPKAETFFFTADSDEGGRYDESIEVRFNDGSLCSISGTLRVILPSTEKEAIDLITVMGFRSYREMEHKLILPVARNAMRMTANLMTARESYSEKRQNYITWTWDQIQNGLYETEEIEKETIDPITGKSTIKLAKIIKRDASGNPIYQRNPLEGSGISLANFEIKSFVYADKVRKQIATQQEALMAVATARAEAERAKQEAKTAEEQGKAQVMKARYEKEQEKIRAVVDAEKLKEVAELDAQKKLEVAKLEKLAAAEEKQRQILLGEGEAKRKALVLAADGALAQKLETYVEAQKVWASAFAKRQVPSVYMGGGSDNQNGSADLDFKQFMMLQNMKNMKDLGLDMTIKKGK